MAESKGKQLTTPQGHQITFRMKLVPYDMKWASSMSGELNNCAFYFSPFANVNQNDKMTMDGSIGAGPKDTWQEWKYSVWKAANMCFLFFSQNLKPSEILGISK